MSKQAWIVTAVILIVCAAAGWFAWSRPNQRTAAIPPSGTNASSATPEQVVQSQPTQAVRIEGCAAYIQPPPGEKLEPIVLPGVSIENLRKVYGRESRHTTDINEWEWHTEDFNLQGWGYSKENKIRSIGLDATPGHLIATPDGIELGKDTFATILQKMKDRGISVSEKMEGAEGTWILFVSFPSVCNPDDWSEYSWYLGGTPKVDDAVGSSVPFHSNIFLNKVVENYSTGIGKESEGDIEGQPSIHQ